MNNINMRSVMTVLSLFDEWTTLMVTMTKTKTEQIQVTKRWIEERESGKRKNVAPHTHSYTV